MRRPLRGCRPLEPFLKEPECEILLLGTFHFSNPGLDSYRPEHDVDIFSERRQAELREVLDRLARFRPTKIAWYNRNLRIFANLLRIIEREDERILLVIGSGHLGILRHAVETSPEYQLVEVEGYLGEDDG